MVPDDWKTDYKLQGAMEGETRGNFITVLHLPHMTAWHCWVIGGNYCTKKLVKEETREIEEGGCGG